MEPYKSWHVCVCWWWSGCKNVRVQRSFFRGMLCPLANEPSDGLETPTYPVIPESESEGQYHQMRLLEPAPCDQHQAIDWQLPRTRSWSIFLCIPYFVPSSSGQGFLYHSQGWLPELLDWKINLEFHFLLFLRAHIRRLLTGCTSDLEIHRR